MNSSTFCSLFLGLILILQSPLSTNARGLLGVVGGELVDELCNGFHGDKIACHNVLGSNSEAMKAESYEKLSEAILKIAINKAVEGQKFLKGLAVANNSIVLTDCANHDYDLVVDSFKTCLRNIKAEPESASFDARVARYGFGNCAYEMAYEKIVNPQVTALNNEMSLFSQMAYYATENLDFSEL